MLWKFSFPKSLVVRVRDIYMLSFQEANVQKVACDFFLLFSSKNSVPSLETIHLRNRHLRFLFIEAQLSRTAHKPFPNHGEKRENLWKGGIQAAWHWMKFYLQTSSFALLSHSFEFPQAIIRSCCMKLVVGRLRARSVFAPLSNKKINGLQINVAFRLVSRGESAIEHGWILNAGVSIDRDLHHGDGKNMLLLYDPQDWHIHGSSLQFGKAFMLT